MKTKETIREKYLVALSTMPGWVTVSEWALKFRELYPDDFAKAEQQAANQAKKSTGLREIAARISSNISTGVYQGQIEIDESTRPRKVKALSPTEKTDYSQRELEADIEPITRKQKIDVDIKTLSTADLYRINEFNSIISDLRDLFELDFQLEHAQAILNPEQPGKHHPDNLQILLGHHNRIKSNSNWTRFTLEEQIKYIESVVECQNVIAKRLNVQIDETVISALMDRLKKVY